ncbi:MAG: magnesium/cobalt transporter CorA [archaeon]
MTETIYGFVNSKVQQLKESEISQFIKKKNSFVWVDLTNQTKQLESVGKILGINNLALSECLQQNARARIVDFDNELLVVLHSVFLEKKKLHKIELDFLIGKNYLVTSHAKPLKAIHGLQEKIFSNSKLFSRGPDYLLFELIDSIVDGFFPLMDDLDELIADLEKKLFNSSSQPINSLFELKKTVLNLRRIVTPQRDVVGVLSKHPSSLIKKETSFYFRDVYDHLISVHDELETHRDLLTGALDVSLSIASNKMNEIMKVLTVIATIMMPLTFITGIYGMNFVFMPEQSWEFGYPFALSLMAIIAFGMLIFFKKKKWF